MANNKDIAKELGKAGGNATLKKYGKEHYRKISNKRWKKGKTASDIPLDK